MCLGAHGTVRLGGSEKTILNIKYNDLLASSDSGGLVRMSFAIMADAQGLSSHRQDLQNVRKAKTEH